MPNMEKMIAIIFLIIAVPVLLGCTQENSQSDFRNPNCYPTITPGIVEATLDTNSLYDVNAFATKYKLRIESTSIYPTPNNSKIFVTFNVPNGEEQKFADLLKNDVLVERIEIRLNLCPV
jgi:hypothetical protein